MNADLSDFVRESLGRGVPREGVRSALIGAGWPTEDVEKALEAYADVDFPVPVPRPRSGLSARDAFLYLVLFLTLYISATSFGALVFQFINRAFPDPLQAARGLDVSVEAVRWALSYLIIALPVFLLLSRSVSRGLERAPEKRRSKMREWLTYLTLFVATGVILGDLIALLYNVLEGELTVRFFLKSMTVGVIAGAVFGYYLWQLKGEERGPAPEERRSSAERVVGFTIAGLGIVAVVGGLFLTGSPESARREEFDDVRVNDLDRIAATIDQVWDQREALPDDLEALARERGVVLRSVRDPRTERPYEYRVTGERTYELCAVFETETPQVPRAERRPGRGRFWTHGVGKTCFDVDVKVDEERTTPAIQDLSEPRG